MPAAGSAAKIGASPLGANPPNSAMWKCPGLNASSASPTNTRTMTSSFHHTSTLLKWAKNFTPNMLMMQKTATIAMLTKMPGPVRTSTPSFDSISHGR